MKHEAEKTPNKQVLPGNKWSPWYKARLAGRGKVLQITKQKNNSNNLPKYPHNVNLG